MNVAIFHMLSIKLNIEIKLFEESDDQIIFFTNNDQC